ncbi:MAG TPA: hydroxymethylbilane synthase [Bryobacteraceae bacterium]|jgi:hydroxymethylbilane synthase
MPITAANTLIIGSRGSALALWQARYVASLLDESGFSTRIEIIKTTGDRLQTMSLPQDGGKGLFTKEIEDALLAGTIDLAVHSLKDLPVELPVGLRIAAIPERENPFDALLGAKLQDLCAGARVGTSSGRRVAQLRRLRSDLDIQPIRGNVDTRLRKLNGGQFEAILLAVAGLKRLGLDDQISQVFSPRDICPAPGQGALAIETRTSGEAYEICNRLNHAPTGEAARCERAVLAGLGGGCQLPLGAFAETVDGGLRIQAVVVSPDGKQCVRAEAAGDDAEELGRSVAEDLLQKGAGRLLAQSA